MAFLNVPSDALRELATAHGVCIRPVVHEVTDTETGQVHLVPTACGATRASKCLPCAEKARRLRMQQCREGWHLEEEPERLADLDANEPAEDETDDETEGEPAESLRRTRSTRRRPDVPDLPKLPVEQRTVGTAFTAPSGRTYRPSMFVTFTLPSYGRVRPDGTPVNPARYDYRRAALDAMHFPKLVDRLWQNVRRGAGYQVQYFAAVEPQRRLAPHLHAAMRGAIPRSVFRAIVAGTYHQVWWPPCDTVEYADRLPVWQGGAGYVDPDTGALLPTWEQALDGLEADAEAEPAHVLQFGTQIDIQGILASEGDADRRVGYLTKYLAKSFSDAYADHDTATPRQRAHIARLAKEVRWLPCTPGCANWLRYGIQPKGAAEGMVPGACPMKVHDEEHLGCGGRRVLVSRLWTGKTLSQHRADRIEVVRQVLLAAGIDELEVDRMAAVTRRADGTQRYEWKVVDPTMQGVSLYRQVMTRLIAERLKFSTQYQDAKERVAQVSASPANAPPVLPTASQSLPGAAPVQGERSESRSDRGP